MHPEDIRGWHVFVARVREQWVPGAEVHGGNPRLREAGDVRPADLGAHTQLTARPRRVRARNLEEALGERGIGSGTRPLAQVVDLDGGSRCREEAPHPRERILGAS